MSATFTSQLRTRGEQIVVGGQDGPRIALRIEMPEVWDVVSIDASSSATVAEVKEAALRALYPSHRTPADFVMKLGGFEVLEESASVVDAGAKNGSIFLLTFRRRRPVR